MQVRSAFLGLVVARARAEGRGEGSQRVSSDRIAKICHKILIIMNIMGGEQDGAQDLARLREVMEVGARIAGTGRTPAGLIERGRVVGVAGVFLSSACLLG